KRVSLAAGNCEGAWKAQRGGESDCQYPGITECWRRHWLVIRVDAAEGQPRISLLSRESGRKGLAAEITDKKLVAVQEANLGRPWVRHGQRDAADEHIAGGSGLVVDLHEEGTGRETRHRPTEAGGVGWKRHGKRGAADERGGSGLPQQRSIAQEIYNR